MKSLTIFTLLLTFTATSNASKTTASAAAPITKNDHHSNAITEGLKNALCSGLSAACVKITLAPFDTIKTIQQQNRNTQPLSFLEGARVALKGNGLYAGVDAAVMGALPSVGLYFGVYSYSKRVIGGFLQERWNREGVEERRRILNILSVSTSAAIGNTVASVARVPYEVIKQKMQTGGYPNTFTAIRSMFTEPNPLRAFFPLGGISAQMVRDIPYAIISLLIYEHLREHWVVKANEREGKASIWRDMTAGGIAGGISSYLTNPMDVIKTRLQTNVDYLGVRDCALRVFKEEGWIAFLKGSKPRLMHKVPANALFFLCYELFRRTLRVEGSRVTSSTTKEDKNDKRSA